MMVDLEGPGTACSANRVRRFRAGELRGADLERTEQHLRECARCQAVLRDPVITVSNRPSAGANLLAWRKSWHARRTLRAGRDGSRSPRRRRSCSPSGAA